MSTTDAQYSLHQWDIDVPQALLSGVARVAPTTLSRVQLQNKLFKLWSSEPFNRLLLVSAWRPPVLSFGVSTLDPLCTCK